MKKMLGLTALVVALAMFFSVSSSAQQIYVGIAQDGAAAVGTEEPCIANNCVMYAGDFDPNGPNPNGLWNNKNTLFGITGVVYVPVSVPKKFKGAKGKTDWNVQGLFTNQQMLDLTGGGLAVGNIDWSIVQGVAAGGSPNHGGFTTICSGSGMGTLTPTGRIAFGIFIEETILVTGVSCPIIEAGQYWMTLVPTTQNLAYLSDVEDNTPTNQQGPGSEPVDQSFFYSPSFGFNSFANTSNVCGFIGCDSFSVGVVGVTTH
jgi:hypothetical protein